MKLFMKLSFAALVAPCAVEAASLRNQQAQEFWPFTSAQKEPVHTVVTPEMDKFGQHEHSVMDMKSEVMSSVRFQRNMNTLCADASAQEQSQCREMQGTRLWCAIFARNMAKMLVLPKAEEERAECKPINDQKDASYFFGESWQIGLADTADGGTWARVADDADGDSLWQSVTGSESFKKKVYETCTKIQAGNHHDECARAATRTLFCQLLGRTKPELVAANCGGTSFIQKPSLLQKQRQQKLKDALDALNSFAPEADLGLVH